MNFQNLIEITILQNINIRYLTRYKPNQTFIIQNDKIRLHPKHSEEYICIIDEDFHEK